MIIILTRLYEKDALILITRLAAVRDILTQ
jgi:hypothetical protein